KVDDATHERVFERAGEEYVVSEEVAVGRAGRQGLPCRRGRGALLRLEFARQQLCLGSVQERQHFGGRFGPPGQSTQIGLLQGEILGGQVRTRQRGACQSTVGGARGRLVAAGQACDDGAGLAMQ